MVYASHAMTSRECRYTQVEKALEITCACKKFESYALAKKFNTVTDHKPLVPLLGSKSLDSLPPRILHSD